MPSPKPLKLIFPLVLVLVAPPALATGDCTDYTDLTALPLPIAVTGTTAGATSDYGPFTEEPACWQGTWNTLCAYGPDVTYKWTAPETGRYAISLANSDFDAELLLYDFTCPDEPVYPDEFVCGAHRNLLDRGHLSNLYLEAGQEILIVVDGYDTQSGAFTLEIFDTDRQFDDYLLWAMAVLHFPGLAVGTIDEHGTLWNACYGYANLEDQRPVTESTYFCVWSVSKAVTAAAVMTSWEDGLFDLDANVNTYLPLGFEVVHPHHPSVPITVRQSMCHVAGIRDNWMAILADANYGGDSPVTLGEFLDNYLDTDGTLYDADANFTPWAPATTWEYAQPDVALAGYVAASVSPHDDFLAMCQARLFGPLVMDGSTYLFEHIMEDEVTYYSWDDSEHVVTPQGHVPCYPAFLLRTNAVDLTRFLAAIMNGGELDGQQVLHPATIDSMLTAQYAEIPSGFEDQGLTWYRADIGGRDLWGHSGGGVISMASIMFSRTENIGAVAMTNCDYYGSGSHPGIQFIVDALLDRVSGEGIIVHTLESGPSTEDAGPPTLVRLHPCHPNPFNPLTTLSFDVPAAGRACLSIHDLRGRLITTMLDETVPAGRHEIVWDGRDAKGREVPSGVYLSRLETGDRVAHGRMMLVR